jgi:DNA repair exonuclease SbcCD nuclease subunit
MIRFIHAADIHLDSPMRGIDSERARIDPGAYRVSTRKALENLVNVSVRENVDFLTLGGDNYDGDWDNFETGLYFQEQMARLGEIPVVSISGNHDAANKMTLRLHMPANFKSLSDERPVEYEVIPGVRVVGQGFRDPKESRNLAELYPRLDGGGVKIGLLHTSLDGREGHARYAPCSVDDLKRRHYHFWGLGHIHKHSWEQRSGDPPILFPGNLQGRHARETGAKGAWLITLDDDGGFRNKEFLELDVTRWMTLEISISGKDHPDEFFKACELEFNRRNLEVSNKIMAVRVRVTGESVLHHHLLSLQEMREDALLANMQSAATNAVAQRIWVEKVELASCLPQSEQRYKPVAFTFLQQFIDDSVLDESWIEKYLKSPEIDKLKKQVGYFSEMDVVRELEMSFDPLAVRELIGEIPEILEMKLGRNQAEEIRDEEK